MARDVFHSQDAGRDLMFSTSKSSQIWLTNAQHTTNILIIGNQWNQQPEWRGWGIGDQTVPEGHLRREVCQRCVVAGGLATQRRSASCSPRRKWAHPGKFTENPEKNMFQQIIESFAYFTHFWQNLDIWSNFLWAIDVNDWSHALTQMSKHHAGLLCANHHGIVNLWPKPWKLKQKRYMGGNASSRT